MSFEWRSSSYVVDTSVYDTAMTQREWKRRQALLDHPVTLEPDHYDTRRQAAGDAATTGGPKLRATVGLGDRLPAEARKTKEAHRQAHYRKAA